MLILRLIQGGTSTFLFNLCSQVISLRLYSIRHALSQELKYVSSPFGQIRIINVDSEISELYLIIIYCFQINYFNISTTILVLTAPELSLSLFPLIRINVTIQKKILFNNLSINYFTLFHFYLLSYCVYKR